MAMAYRRGGAERRRRHRPAKVETAEAEIPRAVDWVIANLETERGLHQRARRDPDHRERQGHGQHPRHFGGRHRRQAHCLRRRNFHAATWTWNGPAPRPLLPYRSEYVLVPRVRRIEAPLDTVWVDLKDAEGFKASTRASRGSVRASVHPPRPGARRQRRSHFLRGRWSGRAWPVQPFETAEKAGSASTSWTASSSTTRSSTVRSACWRRCSASASAEKRRQER